MTDHLTQHDQLARAERANVDLLGGRRDRWYPTFHITAPAGWINDPNGLSHYQGRYQVFFQHYPDRAEWGPMHWGHVSSADLVTWRHEPIALAPSLEEDKDGVWSGSAVVSDDGRLLLFYTGHRWRNGVDESEGNLQVQCLAESTDGVHFEKKGVVVEGPPELLHFRDPKVWRMEDAWYMVFGASSAEGHGQVWLYRSTDLGTWEFDRVVFEDPDPDVYMLECADMFPLGDRWVILYGPMTHAEPAGYGSRNGHNGGYVIGTWAPGEDFTQLTDYRPADWGQHYYAQQSFEAPDGRRIVIGWMGEFALPLASQAEDGWSGQLAVPRELTLDADGELHAAPIMELTQLRRDTEDLGSFTLGTDESRLLLEDVDAYEVELEVDLASSSAEQVGLEVHKTGPGRCTWVAYDDLAARVVLDRRTTSSLRGNGGYRSAPFHGGDRLTLRVLVDRGSVEVFVGDAIETVSSLSFPDDGPRTLEIVSVSGTTRVESLRFHRLAGIWENTAPAES